MESLSFENNNIKGVVSLIGPSFAVDIINKQITIVNAVSKELKIAKKVKQLFSNS
ncbi:Uncharacterised protein [Mycoplasmopsis arginini]|nr:Uncharacterised protein [Chlamydia trachomatis]SGA03251.1 Uncharacterised protein [Chlamydia abortus]SGA15959.1 Uncharacterised protein [Mycoplasmopsis arginini]CRH48989.1 Uncharacterised protein [Chlamydia trachomatis]CRH54628.1 Uncharacterised protein [Chlamydia trachomatis]